MARRPLVEELREIAERLTFVGDDGDRERVLEAAAKLDEQDRPQLDLVDEAQQQEVDTGRRCSVCRELIDPMAEAFLHEERGWTAPRAAGGTNALRFSERTGRIAHVRCLSSDPAQDTLLA